MSSCDGLMIANDNPVPRRIAAAGPMAAAGAAGYCARGPTPSAGGPTLPHAAGPPRRRAIELVICKEGTYGLN